MHFIAPLYVLSDSAVFNFLIDTQVVKYWPDKGKSGFLVWRYLLKRDDDEPAPWTRDGKDRIKKLGLTMQVKIRNICSTAVSQLCLIISCVFW